MITPVLPTRTLVVSAAASTAQTLDAAAGSIVAASIGSAVNTGGSDALTVAIGSGTPAAGNLGFTGSPSATSKSVFLNAAPVAGLDIYVQIVPVGELLASA